MAMTTTESGDARAHLGISSILQEATLSFAAADYPTGGYPINPQAYGLGLVRSLTISGYTGTAVGFEWRFVKAATANITPTFAGNMQVFTSAGGALAQVAAGTDLSGGTVAVIAYGF